MRYVKPDAASTQVFREFAWNIVGVLASGKSAPGAKPARKPKIATNRVRKGGRK